MLYYLINKIYIIISFEEFYLFDIINCISYFFYIYVIKKKSCKCQVINKFQKDITKITQNLLKYLLSNVFVYFYILHKTLINNTKK